MTQTEYGKIGGSLLLDSANSVEEATMKITMYKERSDLYKKECYSDEATSNRYTYVENRAEWWSN